MSQIAISDKEFASFQRFIHSAAGITLSPAKKALVCGRLAKRLHHHQFTSYAQYIDLLHSGKSEAEVQTAVDLLTTNETYFFREPKHFDMLRKMALQAAAERRPMRVWSAACSSGEEVYTIAMVLADTMGDVGWEVMGSDISTRVLQRARSGHYPLERTRNIPTDYLKRFCLRGIEDQEGTLLVSRELRQRVRFDHINLNTALPKVGSFDLIFLRNVMIYFNGDTKRQVVDRLVATLKPTGTLFIGHSESLNELGCNVVPLAPSVYRRAA